MQTLMNDINGSLPAISPTQINSLINSGVNLNTLMSHDKGTVLSSKGISRSAKYQGPASNIVQTDFHGTSNIYSPYLYYNKGTNEQFSPSPRNETEQYSKLI